MVDSDLIDFWFCLFCYAMLPRGLNSWCSESTEYLIYRSFTFCSVIHTVQRLLT